MILEALHTTISAICNAYPMIGDIESVTPFAVYNVTQNVIRDKTGIVGHQHDVTISVVDPDLDNCISKSELIKSAVESLKDTTVNETVFDIVHLRGETQRYDAAAYNYINYIEFSITTQNV